MTVLTKKTRLVPQPPVPQPDKEEAFYALELSPAEVVALKLVLGSVGGEPASSPRAHIDTIYARLPGQLVSAYSEGLTQPQASSIYFKPGTLDNAAFNRAVARLS